MKRFVLASALTLGACAMTVDPTPDIATVKGDYRAIAQCVYLEFKKDALFIVNIADLDSLKQTNVLVQEPAGYMTVSQFEVTFRQKGENVVAEIRTPFRRPEKAQRYIQGCART